MFDRLVCIVPVVHVIITTMLIIVIVIKCNNNVVQYPLENYHPNDCYLKNISPVVRSESIMISEFVCVRSFETPAGRSDVKY